MDKRIETDLNKIIDLALFCPGSEPMWENLLIGKLAYLYLKENNLNINSEKEIIKILSGDNIDGINYLE